MNIISRLNWWERHLMMTGLCLIIVFLSVYCPYELTRLIHIWVDLFHPDLFPRPQCEEIIYIWASFAASTGLTIFLAWRMIYRGGKP